MEKIEQENNILEGEYEEQQRHVKLFRNLQSASDFCLSFGIKNFQIKSGYAYGSPVVQVEYWRED